MPLGAKIVSTELPLPPAVKVTDDDVNDNPSPEGTPEAERETLPAKFTRLVKVIVEVTLDPTSTKRKGEGTLAMKSLMTKCRVAK